MAGLVHLDEVHKVGVGKGGLQHGHLLKHLRPAVYALPPLANHLGSVPRLTLPVQALLHHRELSSEVVVLAMMVEVMMVVWLTEV